MPGHPAAQHPAAQGAPQVIHVVITGQPFGPSPMQHLFGAAGHPGGRGESQRRRAMHDDDEDEEEEHEGEEGAGRRREIAELREQVHMLHRELRELAEIIRDLKAAK